MNSYDNEVSQWEDTFDEHMKEISHLNSEKYLGQMLSSDAKNTKNITKLRNKGIGINNTIVQILQNTPGGAYHFEISTIFRSSYLLSNSEVSYGATKADIDLLEPVNTILLQKTSECLKSTPHDLYYL